MALDPNAPLQDPNLIPKPTNVGVGGAPTSTTPDAGLSANITPKNMSLGGDASVVQGQGGFTDLQAKGVQAINQGNLDKGLSPGQSIDQMKSQPGYDAAKAAYGTPATPSVTPDSILKNENAIATQTNQVYNPTTGQFEAKPAPLPGTGTGAPAGAKIPEDTTKPHSTGDVWNAEKGQYELPQTTTGGVPANIQQITDQIFPKDKYSEEERAGMSELLKSKNPSEIADLLSQNAKGNFTQSQALLDAYRTTRDFGLNQARTKTLNDQRVADMTQQYDTAIQNQKNKMEADANNMSVALGTGGRLQSRNLQNAITSMLDVNKNIYSQLVSNKDRDIARLAEDLKYANTTASNTYNDNVSKQMQDMLTNIQALDKTGSLQTAQGLVQARSFIDATISNNMQHQSDYYSKLSYISQRFDKYREEAGQFKTVDDSVTKTMNDGYLYNSQGAKINDPSSGQPLRVANTSGTLITKDPIVLQDGSKAFVYQNTDGTTRVEKIQGTGATQMTPEAIQHIAQGVSSGAITPELLKSMNLTPQQIQSILTQTTGGGKAEWKVVGKDENGYDKYGWVNPMNQTVSGGGTPSGGGNVNITPGTSGTRADRNNNPGNLRVQGDSGKDSGGFGIFSTPEAGFQAMVSDITSKVNGTSKYSANIHTLKDLISVYAPAGDNNDPTSYSGSVASALGIKPDTPISQLKGMEPELAKAMAKHEGFTGEIKTNATPSTNTEYSQVAQELIDGKTKPSELGALGYNKSQIKQIQYEKLRIEGEVSQEDIQKRKPSDFENIILGPKATAEQSKSFVYANRMNKASEALLDTEKKFGQSGLANQTYQTNAPNFLKSGDQQSLEANKQNFITAVLRQESGASISPTEFAKEEKKYFPQPGDTAKTIAEKQNFRESAIKGMYSEAGKDENGKPIGSYYQPKKIYEDGSYIKYDNTGNYNYVDKSGNESGWKKVGESTTSSPSGTTIAIHKDSSDADILNYLKQSNPSK